MSKLIRRASLPLRNRSGSVLILVVALLVLLALMGTAFISTTRNERSVAIQNNANTQADLLMQGLIQATESGTVGELYGPSSGASSTTYRPPMIDVGVLAGTTPVYQNYTSPSSTLYLADRIPASNTSWSQLGWPLFPTGVDSLLGPIYEFDSPFVQPTGTTVVSSNAVLGPTSANPAASAAKAAYTSGYTIGSVSVNGQVMPTLTVLTASGLNTVVAADADGDGIADSGLFKLPISPIDGITYYGAVRVLDGNSAVNVNTAVSNANDYVASGAPATSGALGNDAVGASPVGFFPSSVGLQTLLFDTTQSAASDFPRAEYYLCDQVMCPVPCTSNPTMSVTLATPITDSSYTPRGDFLFTTLGDFYSAQLARRLNNPGSFTLGVAGAYYPLTPFSLNDAAALASGFCVKTSSTNSDIETWLRNSLTPTGPASAAVPTSAYNPSQNVLWYSTNFNFSSVAPKMPVRSVLTTWNPVADYAPQHYVTRLAVVNAVNSAITETKKQPINAQMLPYDPDVMPASGAVTDVAPGQFVKYQNPLISNAPFRCYECLSATKDTPLDAAGNLRVLEWREEPWTDTPTKANANSADFPTLWRAFYNVMADSSTQTANSNGDSIPPLPPLPGVAPDYITYADVTATPPGTAPAAGTRAWGPFRDPSRRSVAQSVASPINAGEMLQIRAGLAAVNAMDARDSDDDVTSRTFTVTSDAAGATPAYKVTVYGQERQPYISAVAADYTAGGGGTANVTIELYNPDSQPITITNWQIATVTRSTGGVVTLAQIAPGVVAIPSAVIQPGKYLAITNALAFPTASFKPNSDTTIESQLPNVTGLDVAAKNAGTVPAGGPTELVILKPRNHLGTYGSSAVFDNVYDEGTSAAQTPATLANMVPVDMIDFAGAFSKDTRGGGTQYVAYERPHGTSAGGTDDYNWQFVYPGKYDSTAPVPQDGWQQLTSNVFNGGVVTNATGSTNPTVATRSGGGAPTFPFRAIQLACTGWVGPNPTSGAAPYRFPFAGFARNGDILKTPFIGAYVIQDLAANVIALNSITMDASQADAYTSLNYTGSSNPNIAVCRSDEAIGRFVPLAAIDPNYALATPTGGSPGYRSKVTGSVTTINDPYGWAGRIFDYLDVQVSNDDYMPNVDPRMADGSNVNNTQMPYSSYTTNAPKYPSAGGTVDPPNNPNNTTAIPVASQSAKTGFTNGTFEQSVGKQGLININTAPAYVLAQLPGVTTAMANAIVTDRNANGPYQTIFDLNRVMGTMPNDLGCFQTEGGQMLMYSTTPPTPPATIYTEDDTLAHDPGTLLGDFTLNVNFTPTLTDGVRNDWEERTLMLNRISNLITTRSDTFTCYVLLQGWRNAGTTNATLAVQRRAAFILDRTNVTATNSRPQTFTVPTP